MYGFGHNRQILHLQIYKGSGGVGIYVHERVQRSFNIAVNSKIHDGILAIMFNTLPTDYSFMFITCYLPPENSVWGRNSDILYTSHLQTT